MGQKDELPRGPAGGSGEVRLAEREGSVPAERDAGERTRRIRQVERFLDLIDESAEHFCFQTFDDSHKKRRHLARTLHGGIDELFDRLDELNQKGAGVFVAVNEITQGCRRTSTNVTRVRAVFCDFDPPKTRAAPEQFPLPPVLLVETSPGKRHVYWTVDDLPLERFEAQQRGLNAHLGADPKITDLPRVMRVPGFRHMKDPEAPYWVRIVHEDVRLPYTADEIARAFPPKESGEGGVARAGDRISDGSRNDTLYRLGCSLRTKGLGEVDIADRLLSENTARCDPPLPEVEVRDIAKSAASKPPGLSPEYQSQRPHAPETPAEDRRTTVFLQEGELARNADAAQAALEAAEAGIYRQGGRLVRVGRADETDQWDPDAGRYRRRPEAPALYSVGTPALLDALSRAARFEKWDARAQAPRRCDPPGRLADVILSREGQWKVPPLLGHTESPAVTPGYRLISEVGYDRQTGLIVLPHPLAQSRVLRSPTPEAAEEAVAVLRECWSTFPFASPADESAALAGVLTCVHRRALSAAPAVAISASTPGTGKSRLAETFAVVATGRAPAAYTVGRSPEELDKRLDSIILTGDQVALIDNVDRPLRSDTFCATLTQGSKGVRVLGGSKVVEAPTRTAFLVTGNNLVLLGDLQRRALYVRLDAGVEHPEDRVFDRSAVGHALRRRADLLRAAVTIPLAFYAAGCPTVEAPPAGGFEEWDAVVRRSLIWAGLPDPLESARGLRMEDSELVAMRALLGAWSVLWPDDDVSMGDVVEAVRVTSVSQPLPAEVELSEAVRELAGTEKALNPRALGWAIRPYLNRPMGGLRLVRSTETGKGGRYRIQRGG